MYTISKNVENEIILKNSKFITKIYKVYSTLEKDEILNQLKKEYADATHICYAYILENEARFSDDGEPSGTAGSPMMEVLAKKNINYVLAVVIRYFGGIKLGAGGLVRAYSKSVSETLKKTSLLSLVMGYKIEIICPYSDVKKIEYQLKNQKKIKIDYGACVTYTFNVDKETYKKLKEQWKVDILEATYIEKERL